MAIELIQPLSTNYFTASHSVEKACVGQSYSDFSSVNILLHELQLGEQLNESIVQARRADFTLMLAMLADDVREQSQFLLPKSQETIAADDTNVTLRKHFNLPEKASLVLTKLDDINQFNQAQSIVDNDVATIHLMNAIMAKPLAFRDDRNHIESQVLENTSLFTQIRHKELADVNPEKSPQSPASQLPESQISQQTDKTLSQPLKFNAEAWLDGIQKSLVNSPLT